MNWMYLEGPVVRNALAGVVAADYGVFVEPGVAIALSLSLDYYCCHWWGLVGLILIYDDCDDESRSVARSAVELAASLIVGEAI